METNEEAGTVDVSMLAPEDRRLVQRLVLFIQHISRDRPSARSQGGSGRFEVTAAEGKTKVLHQTGTIPRDRF